MTKLSEALQKMGGSFVDLNLSLPRITSGSLVLDRLIGGGYPVQRISEFHGKENAGKTLMCLLSVASQLRAGNKVLFVDQERAFDKDWALTLGVPIYDTDDKGEPLLEVFRPDNGEVALEAIREAVKANTYKLIVLDSLAKIDPVSENESEIDKANVGLQSRLITRFCRVISYPLSYSDTAIIVTNQVRDLIGGYGDPTTTPGGHGMKHELALRMRMLAPNPSYTGDALTKLTLRMSMKKTKIAPMVKNTIELVVEVDPETGLFQLDPISEMFEVAKQDGLFQNAKGEAWTGQGGAFYKGTNLGVGQNAIKAAIADDYDVYTGLYNAIMHGEPVEAERTLL